MRKIIRLPAISTPRIEHARLQPHGLKEDMSQKQTGRPNEKKKKRQDLEDDGRVIANMNVEGMPRSIVRRKAFDEFGARKEEKEPVHLEKGERFAVLGGVITSYLLYGAIFFGALGLFIWFAVTYWFK